MLLVSVDDNGESSGGCDGTEQPINFGRKRKKKTEKIKASVKYDLCIH